MGVRGCWNGLGLHKNPPPLSTPLKPREAGVSSGFPPHMPSSWEIGGKLASWGRRQEGQAGGSELLHAALGAGCLGRRGGRAAAGDLLSSHGKIGL